ncbi:hypothetical protein N7494_002581 [Penicillium frequentans]|uniref:Rhodopsin domain-containing protein n=1 Tax=Penicillium frequentans TaxID=3151616 RepID=A0AAD6D3X6_9EURO|nr:hypothetical protein N7494_002581 [Penicillium glabrum]
MSSTAHDRNSLFLVNYATQILCVVLVTPFVFLRIFVRWKLMNGLGVDDASCFIGWISYVATALYAPTALFVKISLITILIRVFQPYYRAMISLYVLLGTVIGYYTIITFVKIFICNPPAAYWSQTEIPNATCFSQPGVIIADSVIGTVTDAAIFAFPVGFTCTLQMPFWKKVKVIVLLGLAGVAVAFSLYRLVIGVHERKHLHSTTLYMKSILTANAELGLGLICACLPAINVLTSWTRQKSPSVKGYFNRHRKHDQPSGHIYDGPTTSDGRSRNQFVHSHLSSCARRSSTDSTQLIANHEELGMPAGDNNDGIIKMVSLNQHWENASHSNEGAERSEII